MLYLLRKIKGNDSFYLVENKKYIVGRKDCDILLQNDQSISRKHAVIKIENDTIILIDSGSKYNTFHNDNKVEPDKPIKLKHGDEIKFGIIESHFRLEIMEIITTGTQLSSRQKKELAVNIAKLGGKVVDTWPSNCTHLTVAKITLTIKVLNAIIDNIPLVVPDYWGKCVQNMEKNLPFPNIEDYNKPEVAEAILNNLSLNYDERRNNLFEGKLFIFSKTKMKKQMQDVIVKIGGECVSWEETQLTLGQVKKSSKEILVIQMPEEMNECDSLQKIINHLAQNNKRTIPLQEIAMAIIQCSCEKDCNPSFNRAGSVFSNKSDVKADTPFVLVSQSDHFTERENKKEVKHEVIIPETEEDAVDGDVLCIDDDDNFLSISGKRPAEAIKEDNPPKKQKSDTNKENSLSSFMSKSSQSSTSVTSKSAKSSFLSKNPFSTKRKADESTIAEPEPKKPSLFAFKKPVVPVRNKNANPFEMFKRGAKTSENKNEPPAKKVKEVLTSTMIDEHVDIKPLDISAICATRLDGPVDWISKKSEVLFKRVKEEFDEEVCNIIELFKKQARVEIIPMNLTMLKSVTADTTDSKLCITNGKKNFKKFVKIPPKRPQKTIIRADSLIENRPGSTQGISVNRMNFEEDLEQVEPPRKGKRFFK